MSATNGTTTDNDLPLFTSDLKQEVKCRIVEEEFTEEGLPPISVVEMTAEGLPARTVMEVFKNTVEKHADLMALHQKRPSAPGKEITADTPWTHWTWGEYFYNVQAFGKSLLALKGGFQPFDTVNIIGFNSPEWLFANYGAIAAGGVSAGIYMTNTADACKYISEHSKAKVVVCDGLKQLEKYYKISAELPNLQALVMYGSDTLPDDIKSKCKNVPVYTFDDFLKLGKDISDADLDARSDAWKPGHTCSLIYTSGTTGPPKAVMITNDNITWTAKVMQLNTPKGFMDNSDVMISYLPLSHIAAQMIDMHGPVLAGYQIYFAQPDALRGSLGATLKEVRPTIFFGVPRVWEKIYDKLQEAAKANTGVKALLSGFAKRSARAYWEAMEYDQLTIFNVTRVFPIKYYMAKVILSAVHSALGFDRCYAFYVSAAPIDVKILQYFSSLDMCIMETFGQSECCGPHTINTYEAFKLGTVGRPMEGTETKLDPETGELCYRGRHIFAGYLGMPEMTRKTIDPEGWLHSGDVVKMDEDHDPRVKEPSGFVSITGRIKELIITAGGENVPPVLIEDELKFAMPALANVMVIGDKRKFLSVLLCLRVEEDADGLPTNKLTGAALEASKEMGSDATTTDEVMHDSKWKAYFDNGINQANAKATSRAQRVSKWHLLPTNFSEKSGELTPTLKLKRSVTAEKYAKIIDAMYA